MIESVLIANRGEIARRIIRTAKRLGIRTIAVYADVDAALPFVKEADEAHCIGPAPASASYLCADKILGAARTSGAAAIHPGYGFLSENADFADAVVDAGLIWVGAPPAAIRAMGLKDAAKSVMAKAGVPVTPGYLGTDQSPGRLQQEADGIGYPVLIKAIAGGGGKGMRRVETAADFAEALQSCRREAASAFGDDRVLIEKYVTRPRHIEVQIFGDTHGNIVHLFERDCSVQRRHQKVIEEAPAPGMDSQTRAALCGIAVNAARAVNYVGAGTIEFIADASEGLRADRIWFMEMNTRLQVEHPVTEAITGEDLVEWQFRVASGEALPKTQDELAISGWAVEARLYAENPANDFLPSIGPLTHLHLPSGIRVDSGVAQGDEVTAFFDPMIAKLIAHEPTREAACSKLANACTEVEIWPVRTNAGLLVRALQHPSFVSGDIDTGFINRNTETLTVPFVPSAGAQATAASFVLHRRSSSTWDNLSGFRLNAPDESRVRVQIHGEVYEVHLGADTAGAGLAAIAGKMILFGEGSAWEFSAPKSESFLDNDGSSDGTIRSPMPGRIASVLVAEGQIVTKGTRLLVIEAMKMENGMTAASEGKVEAISVKVGDQVSEGMFLMRISPLV